MECTKVLVVDREPGEYEALKAALRRHGYELHTTGALPHALALAGAHQYKVAFVDVPSACSTSFLTDLRGELPELSVILVLSSDPTLAIPTPVLDMAVNAIGKPLALEACRLILDRTLELVTLRLLVRQHRQFWSGMLASHAASINTLADSAATFLSFDAVLTSKLRDMVPHLEVLGHGTLHYMLLSHVEKIIITVVLTECRGNQLRAAELLGINRNTLRKKIREFGIIVPRGGSGAEDSTGHKAQSKRRQR